MKRYLLFFISLWMLPLFAFSQGTTSASLEGVVRDTEGEPLPGANIVAIHEPTGSRYGTSSRSDGRYNLKNLKVGGPYVVEVTFIGFDAQKKKIENLELSETVELDFALQEGSLQLSEISVVAQANPVLNAERTGAQTNISSKQIDENPTISRSLADFARLVPQATGAGGETSFGGVNNRYNNILIDGATLNDVFGLSETGAPGGQAGAQPISLDAIQEFNVDIAPYDVTNSNFTGGQINAITRSGTNNYEGSVYFQGRNERFVGDIGESGIGDFNETFTGFRLGGPIIEDKLFFFVNGEIKRESAPLDAGIIGSGAATIFPISDSTFDDIRNIAQSQYNYDPGTVDPLSQDQDNNKVLAKLDWNINQDHKLSFRYNHVDATDDAGVGRFDDEYDFSNRQYVFDSKQNSYVAELKSTLSDKMFNEARVVYTRIRDERKVQAESFPQVSLILDDGNQINMGIDRFSQANSLDQDLIEITDNFTYFMGDHEFTFGTSNQIYTFDNLFIQDFWGAYQFSEVEDPASPGDTLSAIQAFQRGVPNSYNFSYSLLDEQKPIASFTSFQLGFYAQDRWKIREDLTLTLGLRADIPIFPDEPLNNPTAAQAFPGFSTSNVPSGNILWSPRLGFNWDLSGGARTTQIRGGTGIFAGPPPYVWLSNLYSNTGADFARIDAGGEAVQQDDFFSPDPNNQPRPGGTALVQTSEINLAADDFRFPQTWRSNLGIDHMLPFGILGTAEFIYSKSLNAVVYRNINLESTGTSPYGRTIYGNAGRFIDANDDRNRVSEDFTNALVLDNTDKGFEYSITGKLQKQFNFGLNTSFAYTYNQAKNVNNGTSSRAISNWQFNEAKDINDPNLGISDFRVKHRILATLSYAVRGSEISLVYEGRSGTPFTWIYFGDANADGQSFNDPIYVPESENDIVLTSNNWNALNDFINSQESLRDQRGEIVDRNSATAPWRNILDLKFSQNIPAVTKGNLKLTFEALNFLNLLNSDWGEIQFTSFNTVNTLTFDGYDDATGRPVVSFNEEDFDEKDEYFSTSNLVSRWQLQLGIRYTF